MRGLGRTLSRHPCLLFATLVPVQQSRPFGFETVRILPVQLGGLYSCVVPSFLDTFHWLESIQVFAAYLQRALPAMESNRQALLGERNAEATMSCK